MASTTRDPQHWAEFYERKPDGVSWFQTSAEPSHRLIAHSGVVGGIIDVGGGASVLVDELVAEGRTDLTVLDIASGAIARAQERLGESADRVTWLTTDVLDWRPDRTYGLWHDRAVFHFLTDASDRATYTSTLKAATTSGSVLVVGTFASDGPETCSGLPVGRYSADQLAGEFATDWTPISEERDVHVTPWGKQQPFTWVTFRRK